MECVPCGDPPPPYEPHCKCRFHPVGVGLTSLLQNVFCFNLKSWQTMTVTVMKNSFKGSFSC